MLEVHSPTFITAYSIRSLLSGKKGKLTNGLKVYLTLLFVKSKVPMIFNALDVLFSNSFPWNLKPN